MSNEPGGRGPDHNLPLPTRDGPFSPYQAFLEGLMGKSATKTPAKPPHDAFSSTSPLPNAEPWLRTRPNAVVPATPKVLVFLTDAGEERTLSRVLVEFADCEVRMSRVRCTRDDAPEEGTLAAKYIGPKSGGVHLALHRDGQRVESLVMHDGDAVLFQGGNRNTLADWCATADQPVPGDGQVRAVVFQPQYDWDTHTSPRPFRVIDDKDDPGRVDHQHYWRGRFWRFVGVVDDIESPDIDFWGDKVLACPALALGRYVVFETNSGEDETLVYMDPIERVRVIAANRAELRLEVAS